MILNFGKSVPVFLGGYRLISVINADFFGEFLGVSDFVIFVLVKSNSKRFIPFKRGGYIA